MTTRRFRFCLVAVLGCAAAAWYGIDTRGHDEASNGGPGQRTDSTLPAGAVWRHEPVIPHTAGQPRRLRNDQLNAQPLESPNKTVFKLSGDQELQLCQALGLPTKMHSMIHTRRHGITPLMPWEVFAQGEYVGPARMAHVPEYRIRVDDQLEFSYRRTREITTTPYRLNVGDKIRIESLTEERLDRELTIQPDGHITLPPAIYVKAAGHTIRELTEMLEERYKKLYRVPAITVSPISTETRLEDLLDTVDSRFTQGGGLAQTTRVTPEGTVSLPGLKPIFVNGLSLQEIEREVEHRYAELVSGVGVTPRLAARAPRYVYVLGEVRQPNRYLLEAPTSLTQAIAMAGGWNFGGELKQIVVFRRTEDWQLIATKLNVHASMLGKDPCPADEIWLRDSDIVMIPKSPALLGTDFLDLIFTRGLYRIIPINVNYSTGSSL
jgi:polysaccharide export outer membrane protein